MKNVVSYLKVCIVPGWSLSAHENVITGLERPYFKYI